MENSGKRHFCADPRRFAAGVIYLALIAVVAYGIGDHVYDGFGKVVPWLIMILFAVMGGCRIIEGITGITVPEHIRSRFGAEELTDDILEQEKH